MMILEPFSKTDNPVIVDWDYALKAVENLDTLAQEKNRRAITGKAAISILAEYGAIAYEHATPPDDTKLAIIISPPCVYFCPSQDGLNGVFIEEYNEEKHGKCFFEVTKDDLSCYTSSPIHIAADCLKISTNLIRLTFKDGNDFSDGLLDGGHRLLSLCIAANSKEIDISQVFLNIIIYSGFKGLELKEKAIALNTTKAVSKMSLANYSGDYDWMKQELEKYRIVYYEGQFGLHTTQVDGCCTVSRIAALVLALDTSYKPTAMDERKKHPKYLVGSSNGIRFEIIQKTKKMFSLVHDAISLQSKIFKEIEKRHQSSGTQFTKDAKDARKFTKLPDHEVLSCVITHQLLVLPMISAFRAYVAEENGVLKLQISEKKKAWVIKKMVDRYIEIASQTKRKGQPLSSLAKDDYVWQAMCIISYDLLRID